MKTRAKTERNKAVVDAVGGGEKLNLVAKRMRISKPRVSQILSNAGPEANIKIRSIRDTVLSAEQRNAETKSVLDAIRTYKRNNISSPSLMDLSNATGIPRDQVRNRIRWLRDRGNVVISAQGIGLAGEGYVTPEQNTALRKLLELAAKSSDTNVAEAARAFSEAM